MAQEMTISTCIKLASASASMTAWMREHKAAYRWAYSNGRIRDVIEATAWTVRTDVVKISEIIGTSKRYQYKSDWQYADPSHYALAKYYGIFELCSAHMIPKPVNKRAKKRVLTRQMCIEIASKCKTRTEFKKHDAGAYNCAREQKFLEDCCIHMS